MIQGSLKFDPRRDLYEVDQFGFVNLRESLINGVVPADLGSPDDDYNGIEDPSAIWGRPSDVFDGIRMLNSIHDAGSSSDSGSSVKPDEN